MIKSLIIALIVSLSSALPGFAASSSWFETEGAKIRLIGMTKPYGNEFIAGIQIELEPGWKTYWRSPGGSGLPPQFSFSRSKNVANMEINYPAPQIFGDDKNPTAGYTSSVVFPIIVEPLFENRATELAVDGLVGICAEICVPVQFKLSMTADLRGFTPKDVAIAFNKVEGALPNGPQEGFQISQTKVVDDILQVSVLTPPSTKKATLFVEGPSDWYLQAVRAKTIDKNHATFEVSLKDIPKSVDPIGEILNFVVATDGPALEQTFKLTK